MGYNLKWSETKKNVEKYIKKYINYCLLIDINSTSKISKEFFLEELNSNNRNCYINLTEEEVNKRIDFINAFRMAYNKLTSEERKVIYWTYLDKEHNYDDGFISNELGFSLGYFYIKKKDTIIRLAYALGVEVVNKN